MANNWEAFAWIMIGATCTLLMESLVTGSALLVAPAALATVLALLAARVADRRYRKSRANGRQR